MIAQTFQGVVHGDVIKLDAPVGLIDGQRVEVVVRTVAPPSNWGEGLRSCAGALANDAEAEADWLEIERTRHLPSRQELSE